MTGFGRTGRWFGVDHWGVRPDILVGAKGGTSGYFPFGLVAASGAVRDAVLREPPGFVHGFTYSHHAVGAAVAGEVLRILEDEHLVEASATKGERLQALLRERLGGHPNVGEVRGRGLLAGVELVADRETREPFPRAGRITEAVIRAGRERGVLLYSSTGLADGTNGDAIVLGPPFVVTDDELVAIVDRLGAAIEAAVPAGVGAG
jgi:adenosylmethionine-8-amino-7-oxononanoate aminotransferase